MKRQLLLLRHGKSDWSTDASDFDRPLKDRGKRDVQRIGVWLSQQGLIPDQVIASSAERAKVSAEKLVKAMAADPVKIQFDHHLYAADLDSLLKRLKACPANTRRLLLVGHNPELEALLLYLAKDEVAMPNDGKLLPTASLALLAIDGRWDKMRAGCARLERTVRPKSLPRKFPFPHPDSTEQRDRPAYYYSQSSVIPYRIKDGKTEVLLIRSSGNKRWVVPKGIKEPGLTAQDSAAKEAREEAGISGKVGKQPLGRYSVQKWGGTCSVELYSMKVTRLFDESEWHENHRGRKWLTPEKAAQQVSEDALKPFIRRLGRDLKTD